MKVCGFLTIVFGLLWNYFHPADANALLQPPSRGLTYTRSGNASPSYNYMDLNCGGIGTLRRNEGKCGLCGDPFDRKRKHEHGGKFYTGKIAHRYPAGERYMSIKILLNTEGGGRFEFRLCNPGNGTETEECFNKHLLMIQEGMQQGTMYSYEPYWTGLTHLNLHIPEGVKCERCVLQWKYITSNTWGRDSRGNMCNGCGPQDTFVNCADIKIDGWKDPFKTTPPPPTDPPTSTEYFFPSTIGMMTTTEVPPTTTAKRPAPKPRQKPPGRSRGHVATVNAIRWVRPPDKDEAPKQRQMIQILGNFEPSSNLIQSALFDPQPPNYRASQQLDDSSSTITGVVVPLPPIIPEPVDVQQSETNSHNLRAPYRASGPNRIPRPPSVIPKDAIGGPKDKSPAVVTNKIANPVPTVPDIKPTKSNLPAERYPPKAKPNVQTRRKPSTPRPSVQERRKPLAIQPVGNKRYAVPRPTTAKKLFDIRPYTRGPPSNPPPPPTVGNTKPEGMFEEYGMTSQTVSPTVASWPKSSKVAKSTVPFHTVAPMPVKWEPRPKKDKTSSPESQIFGGSEPRFGALVTPPERIQALKRSVTKQPLGGQYRRYDLSSVQRNDNGDRTRSRYPGSQTNSRLSSNGRSSNNNPLPAKTAADPMYARYDLSRSVPKEPHSESTHAEATNKDPQYKRYDLSSVEKKQPEFQPPKTFQSVEPIVARNRMPSISPTPTALRNKHNRRYNVRNYGSILNRPSDIQTDNARDPHTGDGPLPQIGTETFNSRMYGSLYKSDKTLSSRYPGLGRFDEEAIKRNSSGTNTHTNVGVRTSHTESKQNIADADQHMAKQTINVDIMNGPQAAIPNLGVPVKLPMVVATTKKPKIKTETTTQYPVIVTTKQPIIKTTTKMIVKPKNVQQLRAKLLRMIAAERAKGGNNGKAATPSKAVLAAMREYMMARTASASKTSSIVQKQSGTNNVNNVPNTETKMVPTAPIKTRADNTKPAQPDPILTAAQRRIADQEKQIRLLQEQQKALQDRLMQAKIAQEERARQKKEQLLLEQKRQREEDARREERLRRKQMRAFVRKQIEQRRKMELLRIEQQEKLQAEQTRLLRLKQKEAEQKRQREIEIQQEKERLRLLEIKKKQALKAKRKLEMNRQQERERKRQIELQKQEEMRQQLIREQELKEIQRQQELERQKTEKLQLQLEQERQKMLNIRQQIALEQTAVSQVNQEKSLPELMGNLTQDIMHVSSLVDSSQNSKLTKSSQSSSVNIGPPEFASSIPIDNTGFLPNQNRQRAMNASEYIDRTPPLRQVIQSQVATHHNSITTHDNARILEQFDPRFPSLHVPVVPGDQGAVDTAANKFSDRLSRKMTTQYNNGQNRSGTFQNIEIVPLSKSAVFNILTSIASNSISSEQSVHQQSAIEKQNHQQPMHQQSSWGTQQNSDAKNLNSQTSHMDQIKSSGSTWQDVTSGSTSYKKTVGNPTQESHLVSGPVSWSGRAEVDHGIVHRQLLPEKTPTLRNLQIKHALTDNSMSKTGASSVSGNPSSSASNPELASENAMFQSPSLLEMNSMNNVRKEPILSGSIDANFNSFDVNANQKSGASSGVFTGKAQTYSESQPMDYAESSVQNFRPVQDNFNLATSGRLSNYPVESQPNNGKVQALFSMPGSHLPNNNQLPDTAVGTGSKQSALNWHSTIDGIQKSGNAQANGNQWNQDNVSQHGLQRTSVGSALESWRNQFSTGTIGRIGPSNDNFQGGKTRPMVQTQFFQFPGLDNMKTNSQLRHAPSIAQNDRNPIDVNSGWRTRMNNPQPDMTQGMLPSMRKITNTDSQMNGGNRKKLLVLPINRQAVMDMLRGMPVSNSSPGMAFP